MADKTHIQWTDATWNPITGCSVVSPGCTNCYAMQLAGTRLKHHPSRAGLTREINGNHVWTGDVRFNAEWLTQPLRWSKPRRIFVGAHTDLFHPNVPDEWLDQIFAVMALTPHHIYQILTKRPDRMRAYISDRASNWRQKWADAIPVAKWPLSKHEGESRLGKNGPEASRLYGAKPVTYPLPNVWLGVSVEDQSRADERIPVLLNTPAALRWISAEPLLGPVDLVYLRRGASDTDLAMPGFDDVEGFYLDALNGGKHIRMKSGVGYREAHLPPKLDWVVIGGESGPKARPMHPHWAMDIRDQCEEAGVPFFFKQWGAWLPRGQHMANGQLWNPSSDNYLHVAKSLSGDYLDGVQHHNWPEVVE